MTLVTLALAFLAGMAIGRAYRVGEAAERNFEPWVARMRRTMAELREAEQIEENRNF